MHKLEQLQMNNEVADEISLRKQIEDITKDLPDKKNIKLTKTGIEEVDDMLDYMQSECTQNKIEFQLQVIDSIFYIINHYINKQDLKILLADHIKDAIIAINHSDNINKSILVKIGKIAGIYGVYFYDSGIEFEIDTLVKLGNKPITTHKDEGGTGMGFVNTFKALSKSNASLEIEEIGKPTKDNYTKILKVEFDNKNEFRIKTYRKEEIKSKKIENKLTCGALYVYNIKLNIRNSIIAIAKVLLFVSLSFFLVINLYATYSPMIMLKIKIKTSITIRLPPIIPEYVKNVTTINVIAVNIPIVFASI